MNLYKGFSQPIQRDYENKYFIVTLVCQYSMLIIHGHRIRVLRVDPDEII